MAHNVIDLDDDAFFSMAAAATAADEAAALAASSSKRQKLSSAATAATGGPDSSIDVPEGPYMAALRGSRSSLWQQQMQQQPKKGGAAIGKGSGGSTGPCFTCGIPGHWSRDCPQGGGGAGGGGARGDAGDVPEKVCPCGIGSYSVLTSNTAKNPGRKFYRCPQRPVCGRDTRGEVRGLGSGISRTAFHASAPSREIAQREKRKYESMADELKTLKERLASFEQQVASLMETRRPSEGSNSEGSSATESHILSTCLVKNFRRKVVALGRINREAVFSDETYNIVLDNVFEPQESLYDRDEKFGDVRIGDLIT